MTTRSLPVIVAHLMELIILELGGYWRSWDEVRRKMREVTP